MKKEVKTTVIVWSLIAVLTIGFLLWSNSQNQITSGNYDDFAKCLTKNGAKMYGAFWCSHCKAQKEMFGESWQYINYIECSEPDGKTQTQICADAGISGYPTWEFKDGSRISGGISVVELSDKTNCNLDLIKT